MNEKFDRSYGLENSMCEEEKIRYRIKYNMSLLKCPECNHNVSEHALACPECGCTIEYIKNFYKYSNAKINPVIKEHDDLYSSLTNTEREFVDRLFNELHDENISFIIDKRDNFIGFGKTEEKSFMMYLSRHENGDLIIHMYDPKKFRKTWESFRIYKIEEYLSFIKHTLFGVEKQTGSGYVKSFVIRDIGAHTYFKGFHNAKMFETVGYDRSEHGSFKFVEIPDFVLGIENAMQFVQKESAEKIIKKIKNVCGELEIIEHYHRQ